jgi:suppressor of fused
MLLSLPHPDADEDMSESSESTEMQAPGWDAITDAATQVYGEQQPLHFAPTIPFAVGGSEPLDGVSAYASNKEHPHWHYVTYGLTELYEKVSEDPATSGFGYEFTFRLRVKETKTAPIWVTNFLNNLANHSFQTGRVFAPGGYLDLMGPIVFGKDTEITAVVFVEDPELKPIQTPNGKVEFLQIVGLTADELAAIKRWNSLGFIELMKQQNPLLITSIKRTSLLQDPAIRAAVEEGSRKEGSSTEAISSPYIMWNYGPDNLNLVLDAKTVKSVQDLLPLRIPYGKDLTLIGQAKIIVLKSGEGPAIAAQDDVTVITLGAEQAAQLVTTLQPKEGSYEIPGVPEAKLHVCKFEISDPSGRVIETIG